ncbi:permease [Thermodesulfobacteriota bacterium]
MTLLIMMAFAGTLTFIAYQKGPGVALAGLKSGGTLFLDILPAMVFAFTAAGMMMHVLPRELLTQWMGEESGIRGLIIATLAGSVTPGGPFIQFPIVAALFKAGAGIAPIITYITAWSLLGVNRFLIYEIPMLGLKLSLSRLAVSLIFPIIIGLITRFIYNRF